MIIAVASGKGGTGKTTFTTNTAWALGRAGHQVQVLDADVEEPNGHLFVDTGTLSETPVYSLKPVWESSACTSCGACVEACTYNALAQVNGQIMVFNELCHACGVCSHVCPTGALSEHPHEIGVVRSAANHTPFFFADGRLHVGEPSAPSVIRALKQQHQTEGITLIDAAPGTGCPVVESVNGAALVVLITEPTPFGLHDLRLAVDLTRKLRIPAGVVINRSDGEDALIADYTAQENLPIFGRIPFQRAYAETYSRGALLAEEHPEIEKLLLDIFDKCVKHKGAPVPAYTETSYATTEQAAPPPSAAPSQSETVIISGKGGTGKTSISAALAQLGAPITVADLDVDAADLHLLLRPKVKERHPFFSAAKAHINSDICTGCGLCEAACHFDAIDIDPDQPSVFMINPTACEGCQLCWHVCPAKAIDLHPEASGSRSLSETDTGLMAHAELGVAQESSGKLVAQVRSTAAQAARGESCDHVLADGPPGTSCPVIASITGAKRVLIVTEPTVSGVHDLKRVLNLCNHFKVPAAIAINKADLNPDQVRAIHTCAQAHNVRILGEISFDEQVQKALMQGQTLLHYPNSPAAQAVTHLHQALTTI